MAQEEVAPNINHIARPQLRETPRVALGLDLPKPQLTRARVPRAGKVASGFGTGRHPFNLPSLASTGIGRSARVPKEAPGAGGMLSIAVLLIDVQHDFVEA